MKIVIDISNEEKAKHLIDLLKDIPYVKKIQIKSEKKKGKPNFESIFGVWKERDITLESIRKKAWGNTIR
ncbi:hypothetical protein GWK41_07585 [Persephonella atlantica]|uniref:Uncharacterized protein n=1 Tax=Persephonella atlantica TaxID=2699429 RepID=A0ABS1GJ22_9AQUI|nr:hypothetical protein [Persephonella atlantica]MBK3332927.1 hypothetical protein [Persephonella atlantica]